MVYGLGRLNIVERFKPRNLDNEEMFGIGRLDKT